MPAPFSGTGGCPCPLVSAHHGELEAWGDFGEGKKKKEKLNSFLPLQSWGRCLRQPQLPSLLAAPLLLLLSVLADPPASGRIYLCDPSFI